MALPNFLVIGAAKAGTSALYRYLMQHPQIYMSPKKEPHFFSFDSQTKHTKGPGDSIPLAITDLPAYEALFSAATHELAIGEASPTYLYRPGTAERIAAMIPSVKMVAILRQPAARAFSAYMHLVRDGWETILDFEKAIGEEEARTAAGWGPIWHYIKGGLYHEQLLRYFRVFSPDQLLVLIYDDFRSNPLDIMRNVFTFIGVDPDFAPDMSVEANVSGIPKNRFVQAMIQLLFMKPNPIRAAARRWFPEEVRWRVTSTVRNRNLRRASLSSKLRHDLTCEYFAQDIGKLEFMLEKDLSAWLT